MFDRQIGYAKETPRSSIRQRGTLKTASPDLRRVLQGPMFKKD